MDKIEVLSPAKINLGLNIISKRGDGFHNLETIFYPINLNDKIRFEKSERTAFSTNNEQLKTEADSNLVLKALHLLEQLTGRKLSSKIFLEKLIPTGAGLGGGSSNAASTLLALNELFELNLSIDDLKPLALQLGSDVPFFLHRIPCFAEGRGEMIIPVSLDIPYPILLVNPNIHISTAWAFNNIVPKITGVSLKIFTDEIIELKKLFRKLHNDFEEPVFKEHPKIQKIKTELIQHGAMYAQMSGSGSTVFGIFDDEKVLAYLINYFSKKGYMTFVSQPQQFIERR